MTIRPAGPREPRTGAQLRWPVIAALGLTAATAAFAEDAASLAGRRQPAVARGGDFMGFPERFNRYYTDPSWLPSRIVYVSPDGGGDGARRDAPMAAEAAVAEAAPGTLIHFARGSYQACMAFEQDSGGTYDEPVVLYGERNDDLSLGVSMACCESGRKACFNFENAGYIAVDGFELVGGAYGVRAVGGGYAASEHVRGIAVLNSDGHDQDRDPFFSGQADWSVWEANVAHRAGEGDGHGIYLSNGSDWNIVRFNETFSNASSDFQVNADPASTCAEAGIAFDDPLCDDSAGAGDGGRGASDYFLVDSNYFHHGDGPGANFTGMRRSIVRNNVFGPEARHGVSFWQETDNPKLGSSDNKVLHNLFITTGRHAVQFVNQSTRNEFANNLVVGIDVNDGAVAANPSALLLEVDDTVADNVYVSNVYASGVVEGRSPGDSETVLADFSQDWFTDFATTAADRPEGFQPTRDAPFLGSGTFSEDAPLDRSGTPRSGPTDPGPIELP